MAACRCAFSFHQELSLAAPKAVRETAAHRPGQDRRHCVRTLYTLARILHGEERQRRRGLNVQMVACRTTQLARKSNAYIVAMAAIAHSQTLTP